ncbi:hypothetical protein ACSNOU_18215 [Acinetobacter oleivorans]|uniref:hypothetical protein n=1 Tax=Acinetobacter oleivorans TaxID=1148157 RepID=UPI003F1E2641
MSYTETFLFFYPFFSLLLIIGGIVAVFLPDKLCNTNSIDKHWIIVGLVSSGLIGVRDHQVSLLVLAMVIAAIIVSYLRGLKKRSASIIEQQTSDFIKRIK